MRSCGFCCFCREMTLGFIEERYNIFLNLLHDMLYKSIVGHHTRLDGCWWLPTLSEDRAAGTMACNWSACIRKPHSFPFGVYQISQTSYFCWQSCCSAFTVQPWLNGRRYWLQVLMKLSSRTVQPWLNAKSMVLAYSRKTFNLCLSDN